VALLNKEGNIRSLQLEDINIEGSIKGLQFAIAFIKMMVKWK